MNIDKGYDIVSKVDKIYNDLIKDIYENGIWDTDETVRTVYADGTPAHTKSIIGKQVVFEAEDFPMITTKKVTYKSALSEIWWIWFLQSNDVGKLNELGSSVWNEWEQEDGTIGTAYGHNLNKKVRNVDGNMVSQVEYLLLQLKNNPSSRRHVVSLWSPEFLDTGSLEPCVWSSQWIVQNGKLNLIVNQRSADSALGVLFNWTQYKLLQMFIASVSDLEVGRMIWNYGHLHYYDRHEELLLQQIQGVAHTQPKVTIADKDTLTKAMNNTNITKEELHSLVTIENYKHSGVFKYEIAI